MNTKSTCQIIDDYNVAEDWSEKIYILLLTVLLNISAWAFLYPSHAVLFSIFIIFLIACLEKQGSASGQQYLSLVIDNAVLRVFLSKQQSNQNVDDVFDWTEIETEIKAEFFKAAYGIHPQLMSKQSILENFGKKTYSKIFSFIVIEIGLIALSAWIGLKYSLELNSILQEIAYHLKNI